jgi:methylmalonyl-CoA mutase C-terminal domain/subunit
MTAVQPVRRIRVLLAKVGLDGHDRGVKVVARLLRDLGYEVVYTGIRVQPRTVAAIARDEDVDIVGLSVLSGAHLKAVRDVMEALGEQLEDPSEVEVVIGGTIPAADEAKLRDLGIAAVFGVGSNINDVRAWFLEYLQR